MPQTTSLASLSLTELEQWLFSHGEKKFRAQQIYEWLHMRGVRSFEGMSNISKALREKLAEEFILEEPELLKVQESEDRSRKYLLKFSDGARCEAVGMPGLKDPQKLTVCISSQAGCAMACSFCATGKLGLERNLSTAEMLDQVRIVATDFDQRVSNVVVMGQGEPFANYENLMKTLRTLNHPKAYGIGARHITVSTCGLVPKIKDFAREPEQFTLAISLHSAVQETRDKLMPSVKHFNLKQLYKAVEYYAEKTGRRPSYEYALMRGVNDSKKDLAALLDFTISTLCHVNIIQLNEVEGSPYQPVSSARAHEFVRTLSQNGVEASIRNSRGQDIDAACGQLAAKSK